MGPKMREEVPCPLRKVWKYYRINRVIGVMGNQYEMFWYANKAAYIFAPKKREQIIAFYRLSKFVNFIISTVTSAICYKDLATPKACIYKVDAICASRIDSFSGYASVDAWGGNGAQDA